MRRKGLFRYKRWCRAKISKDCQDPFLARKSRTKVCPSCAAYLKSKGIPLWRYLKMQKTSYKEEVEWTDKDNAKIKRITSIPVKNGDEVVGRKDEVYEENASYDDIHAGLLAIEKTNENIRNRYDDVQKQIESHGKKPVMTGELARLRKAMEDFSKLNKIEELEKQRDQIKGELERSEQMLFERRKVLTSRPE